MIRVRVQEVARSRGITTIKELGNRAGLAYDTASDFWHGSIKRVDLVVLDRICKALQCRIEDVLEQVADRPALHLAEAWKTHTRWRAVQPLGGVCHHASCG